MFTLHPLQTEENPKQAHRKNRQSGLLVGGVLALITAWFYWQKGSVNLYLFIPSLLLLTMAVWMPTHLTFFRQTWEKIGLLLGTVNSYYYSYADLPLYFCTLWLTAENIE